MQRPSIRPLLNLLQYSFMIFLFDCMECGILSRWPGIKLSLPTLESKILTTGPLGMSLLGTSLRCIRQGFSVGLIECHLPIAVTSLNNRHLLKLLPCLISLFSLVSWDKLPCPLPHLPALKSQALLVKKPKPKDTIFWFGYCLASPI